MYVLKSSTTSPFTPLSITAIDAVTLEQHLNAACLELVYARAFDATNLYGIHHYPGSFKTDILIAPRAP